MTIENPSKKREKNEYISHLDIVAAKVENKDVTYRDIKNFLDAFEALSEGIKERSIIDIANQYAEMIAALHKGEGVAVFNQNGYTIKDYNKYKDFNNKCHKLGHQLSNNIVTSYENYLETCSLTHSCSSDNGFVELYIIPFSRKINSNHDQSHTKKGEIIDIIEEYVHFVLNDKKNQWIKSMYIT